MDEASLRRHLGRWGELRSQPASNWKGEFPLPAVLAEFYERVGPWGETIREKVGPIGLMLEVGGEPVCIPPLHKLRDLQAGYRWHGITGERLPEWKEEWLVVAEQGGDPFILEISSGRILFDVHGSGTWNPQFFAPDLETAFIGLAIVADTMDRLGEARLDESFDLTPAARKEVVASLAAHLGSEAKAGEMLATWNWYA